MNLIEMKQHLQTVDHVAFVLPNGTLVPSHFHVTEVGAIQRHFIDCGGTIRLERAINFQLWTADDVDHRLAAEKLTSIIELAEKQLLLDVMLPIEVEYQQETIGKYGLTFQEGKFYLVAKQTACLAEDACGIPSREEKPKVQLVELGGNEGSCCTPGGGCC